jgi:Uncharacterized conserved protein
VHRIASGILSFLLSPLNWLIIFLILGYYLRRPQLKMICRLLAVFIFVFFSNEWILDRYAKNWQPAPVDISPGTVYSCGIVPGGFATPDENSNGYFNTSADRFIQAVKLYKLGVVKHLLISGGNGKTEKKDFREAEWVKKELMVMGIPDSVIYVEDKSNNTADNAKYSRQILDSIHLDPPYLLITSAVHMPRASVIFKNAGIPTTQYPCNYIAGRGIFHFSDLVPKIPVLSGWNVFLKEGAGYLWYKYFR